MNATGPDAVNPPGATGPVSATGPAGATDAPGAARPDAGVAQTAPLPRTRAARLLTGPIVAYRRWVSPALPARCRFYPSCSAYALEAIAVHGALRGTGLTLWRLLRCQPFHPGGYDPVPDRHHGSRCADADGTDRPAPPAARRARRTDATGAAT